MKNFIKRAFQVLLIFVLLMIVVALVVIQKPERILTPERLSRLADKERVSFNSKGQKSGDSVQWAFLKIELHSESFFKKRVTLSGKDVCIKTSTLNGCFTDVSFAALAGLVKFKPALIELGPVTLKSPNVNYDTTQPAPAQAASTEKLSSPLEWMKHIASTKFQPFDIEFAHWKVLTQDSQPEGDLSITTPSSESGDELHLKLVAHAHKKQQKAELASQLGVRKGELWADINLAIRFSKKPQFFRLENCKISLKSPDQLTFKDLDIRCPMRADLPEIPVRLRKVDFPKLIRLTLDSKIHGDLFPYDDSENLSGDLKLSILPFKTKQLSGDAIVDNHFDGKPDLKEYWRGKLGTKTQLKFSVTDFHALVQALKGDYLEIPAPLAVLRGTIDLKSGGTFDPRNGKFPLGLVSRLQSKNQSLDTDTSGEIQLTKKEISAKIDVQLTKVRIELPKISISGMPQVMPDSRITRGSDQKSKSPSPVHYQVHVETPKKSPILIKSNLTEQDVPIGVDVALSDASPLSGTVSILPFPLKLFQRDVKLQNMDMTLKTPAKDSEIDGLLQVKYVDYVFQIQVLNTIEKPKVILTSTPTLPDDQIIAALLFGKTQDALDPDQSSSVGNAKAAITDGAVNLFSLYTLASTPVQSVGYDPSTGVVTAKVKLAEGTSLNLGADQNEVAQTGIKKRLGSHWSVETDINHPADPVQRTVSAMLEWGLRY